jgi:hypothetical protein
MLFGQRDSLFRVNDQLKGVLTNPSDGVLIRYNQTDKLHPFELRYLKKERLTVDFWFRTNIVDSTHVVFEINKKTLPAIKKSNRHFTIALPYELNGNQLVIKKSGKVVDRIPISHTTYRTVPLLFVPQKDSKLNEQILEDSLNHRFSKAFVQFDVSLAVPFVHDGYHPLDMFSNPSAARDRYTSQMIHLRDLFLGEEGKRFENTVLFFEISSFRNKAINGYMVRDKALGFVVHDSLDAILNSIENQLIQGFLHAREDKFKLLHVSGLLENELFEAHRIPDIYSFIDDYEDVKTNNGLVAYYLFEVNEAGNVVVKSSFLESLHRPIKKNTFSYHLEVNNIFYKELFQIRTIGFNLFHIVSFVLFGTGWFILGRKIRSWFKTKLKRSWLIRLLSIVFQYVTYLGVCVLLYFLINLGYGWFEVENGNIRAFEGKSIDTVIDELTLNIHPNKNEEKNIASEIVLKKGSKYELLQRKPVLYFLETVDGATTTWRFEKSSDSIHLEKLGLHLLAKSHYFIKTKKAKNGQILEQRLFNHLGIDLTNKLNLEDPPKRILVFVNGYRPTSLGSSFEENFADIQNNGLEFPNSLNRLFTNDRYNYWNPWNKIDEKFKHRMNPTEVYYADGHHSVSTSNHRSLINFTTNSSNYPERCSNKKSHRCFISKTVKSKLFGARKVSTYDLLATKPNKRGFRVRMNSGRIAGRNMEQLLNELPNTSKNDTIYIVAHSMGFAYAQGMIEYLRGKVNFGSYYILAPENGSTGHVNKKEWKNVWQYGSALNRKGQDAPCLQDGVAPQSGVGGLPEKNRIFIPEKYYKQKGYFDSHFIGYYTWIFQIPPQEPGFVVFR